MFFTEPFYEEDLKAIAEQAFSLNTDCPDYNCCIMVLCKDRKEQDKLRHTLFEIFAEMYNVQFAKELLIQKQRIRFAYDAVHLIGLRFPVYYTTEAFTQNPDISKMLIRCRATTQITAELGNFDMKFYTRRYSYRIYNPANAL